MEAFEFLSVDGEKVFTILHRPDRSLTGRGVLMIHPLAEEKLWAGRATCNLARALCEAGLCVFRFDLRGHGDSDREQHEMDLDSISADISAAAEHFREIENLNELHLLGFRFGATLALRHAAELDASSVALVNPLVAGGAYLKKLLRSNLTTQISIHGEVRKDREALLAEMAQTGLLNIDGYHLSKTFYEQCETIDFKSEPPAFAGPGLLLSLVRREGAPADAESRAVHEACLSAHEASRLETLAYPPIWSEQKTFATGDQELFAPIVDWFSGFGAGEASP